MKHSSALHSWPSKRRDWFESRIRSDTPAKDVLKNDGFNDYYGLLSGKSFESDLLSFSQRDLEWRTQVVQEISLVLNLVKLIWTRALMTASRGGTEREEVLTREVNEIYAANKQ